MISPSTKRGNVRWDFRVAWASIPTCLILNFLFSTWRVTCSAVSVSFPKIEKTLRMFFTTSWVKAGGQDSSWKRVNEGPSFQRIPKTKKSNRLGRLVPAESMIPFTSTLVLIALMMERSLFRSLKVINSIGIRYFLKTIRSASLTFGRTLGSSSLLITPSVRVEKRWESWLIKL